MKKFEYDLSLSNDNFRENRVDELDNFLNMYYHNKYNDIIKIYNKINPIFGILTFLSIPLLVLILNKSMIFGMIFTIIDVVGLFLIAVYMDQKPKSIKKDIFTYIHEDHKYILTDIEYEILSLPVIYNGNKMYYYEFITGFTNDYRINISDKIDNATLLEDKKASYEEVVQYLNKKVHKGDK